MIQLLLLVSLAAPAPTIAAALGTPAPLGLVFDEDEEVPDKRPEVKELLARLKAHSSKRGDEDKEAVAVIDLMLVEFRASGPWDRGAMAKGLGNCLSVKRRDLTDGVKDNSLFLASAVALGEMGADATKHLLKWIGHKRHRKNIALQRQLILSLGKTRDLKATEELTDLLKSDVAILVGAAAEALVQFDGAPLKTRKKIFNELLKMIMTTKATKDSNPNDIAAREKWDIIAAPIITTLQALSGHDARRPEEWQRWWNKNKKKDWDKED
ncbi:MAG: hypothetical protein ABGY71_08455 [bacterium]|jgi:hypothetical protein|nr:hypothetical protein [Planctomycetota bacterium]HIL52611.1 hypothetical protein [Planctomycetota bacterium]